MLLAAVLAGSATWVAPRPASAVEVAVEGGPHLVLWSMSAQLGPREHRGFAYGVGGRLGVVLARHLRLRLGYQPGHFKTSDESEIDRSTFSLDIEGSVTADPRRRIGLGVRVAADHLSVLETVETHNDGSRRMTHLDAWGVMVMPYLIAGFGLTSRMRLELESGLALSFVDGRLHTDFACILAFMFTFEVGG
jgi:hypothetical protein